MKKFYDTWSTKEVNIYLETKPLLVVFKIHKSIKEAELVIYGKLNVQQELVLKVCILTKFGGKLLSSSVCKDINEYAVKWYNLNVAPQKIRVINFKKKRR